MFGLFKNTTPEGKLETDIKKSLEQEVTITLREVGNNGFIAGFAIEAAISNVYKAYIDNANLLAQGHGLSLQKTILVIKKATNEVRNKHLVNPDPIQ